MKMNKVEKRISAMAITHAHAQCIVDLLPELEQTPLFRHGLKRHVNGMVAEYDKMTNSLFKNASDQIETADQSYSVSVITNCFLRRMFVLGNKLTDAQKELFTKQVDDLFKYYENEFE